MPDPDPSAEAQTERLRQFAQPDDPAESEEMRRLVDDMRARGRAPFPDDLPDRSPLLTGQPTPGDGEPDGTRRAPLEEPYDPTATHRLAVNSDPATEKLTYYLPWQGARNGREIGAWMLGVAHTLGKPFRCEVQDEQLAGATGVLVAAGVTVRQVGHDPANHRYVLDLEP